MDTKDTPAETIPFEPVADLMPDLGELWIKGNEIAHDVVADMRDVIENVRSLSQALEVMTKRLEEAVDYVEMVHGLVTPGAGPTPEKT